MISTPSNYSTLVIVESEIQVKICFAGTVSEGICHVSNVLRASELYKLWHSFAGCEDSEYFGDLEGFY